MEGKSDRSSQDLVSSFSRLSVGPSESKELGKSLEPVPGFSESEYQKFKLPGKIDDVLENEALTIEEIQLAFQIAAKEVMEEEQANRESRS